MVRVYPLTNPWVPSSAALPRSNRGAGQGGPVRSAIVNGPVVVGVPTPKWSWRGPIATVILSAMQVISSRRGQRRRPATAAQVLFGGFLGATLLVAGVALGWLTFATPILHAFDMPVRPNVGQMPLGAMGWTLFLTAPAACILLGVVRLLGTSERIASRRPRPSVVSSLAGTLGAEYAVAVNVQLPDGRAIPEIVIGPHGVAGIETLPPPSLTRHSGGRWEARLDGGRWSPMESPLDRASRDAARVRRWFASDDRDFVVKVYAAVIALDESLPRTPSCAVVTRGQIPAWLAALPIQRSLNASRRERLVALMHESV